MQPARQVITENSAEQIAREYGDFAYIVSHDLNAPLRHVKEFTRLLVAGRGENLTEEEKQYIIFLEKSLQKLDDMQQALLTFSRIDTQAGQMRKTDSNESVATALRALSQSIKHYTPEIKYADLPMITVEPRQIELLFFHLIDNALKFHDDETAKRKISISAKDQGDVWLFQIKDNGIGIQEKYWKEIFRLFYRLEPDQYPGIGAGLTFAHKIIRRHGGKISINSQSNVGTTIYFSLKK